MMPKAASVVVPGTAALPPGVRRVAMLSVHTSPLDQPGIGDGGGLNVYVLQTARRLAARGIEVDVFTRRATEDAPDTEELAPGLALHRIDAGARGPMPKTDLASRLCAFALGVERHPRAGSWDLMHAHYWLSGWVARRVRANTGVPYVMTYHTLGVLKNETLAPGDMPEPAIRLVAERRIAADADRIAVLTCGEARLVHKTFGTSGMRIGVVPAGVDLASFGPDGPVAADAPSGSPLLLFVGRLQPLKGPDVAVRTLAAVRERLPEAHLAIVGGTSGAGDGRSSPVQLRALAASLGVQDAVSFHPPVPQSELPSWYRAADLLLAPSRSETFGLVPLEAQACGIPVIAADVPGLRATVRSGGVLVPGHDPARHAAAVIDVATDPQQRAALRAGGLRFAASTTWDSATDRLLRVYGEAVERSTPLAVAG
jgi:D-inositol-3-phosphate glycosyltransferase